jgi:hypothetical protein
MHVSHTLRIVQVKNPTCLGNSGCQNFKLIRAFIDGTQEDEEEAKSWPSPSMPSIGLPLMV